MCGICGLLYSDPEASTAPELLDALFFLQHRGQDAAGIVTCGPRGRLYQCKGNGMVRDVFSPARTSNLVGNMGIGHVRYPTAGSSANSEAQPFYVNSPYGIVLAHNGNLVNADELKDYLDMQEHRHINTDSDSELLLNVFAAELQKNNKIRVSADDLFSALNGVFRLCKGGFACVCMLAGYGLIAFRDANGIRPLVVGERKCANGTVDYSIASESVVLTAQGFNTWRDLKPGEAVIIPKETMKPIFRQVTPVLSYTPDIFEYVYFARPDSVMDGISVYRSRLAMGDKLAENVLKRFGGSLETLKQKIDVVVPVPDTARHAALQLSVKLGLSYREAFVKNRYIGRTFIMPNQKERQTSVRRKLNVMASEFANRNILIVDDSIVRGTTSKEIVAMAREAGAKSVIFASAAPVIRFNHVYGIDLADTHALVGYNRTEEEISKVIGADMVIFQTLKDLETACLESRSDQSSEVVSFEAGVFTGDYVTGVKKSYLDHLETLRKRNQQLKSIHQSMSSDSGPGNPLYNSTFNNCATENIEAKAATDINLYNAGDYA